MSTQGLMWAGPSLRRMPPPLSAAGKTDMPGWLRQDGVTFGGLPGVGCPSLRHAVLRDLVRKVTSAKGIPTLGESAAPNPCRRALPEPLTGRAITRCTALEPLSGTFGERLEGVRYETRDLEEMSRVATSDLS